MSRPGDLPMSREPLNQYGNLEETIRGMRAHRPLDLSAERWRAAHPDGTFAEWQKQARNCLLTGLHYDPGPLELQPEVTARVERDGLIVETVEFNTTPWIRVEGFFLRPQNATGPLPGLVVFHAWGGPMLFGKERILNTGRDHPVLAEHR
ncbi:MAG: hypothetical protein HOH74_00805, partial [Gemmatimonadetes bacterium]|nr:hypothetical protein [Gemmatimonadota bacterium]